MSHLGHVTSIVCLTGGVAVAGVLGPHFRCVWTSKHKVCLSFPVPFSLPFPCQLGLSFYFSPSFLLRLFEVQGRLLMLSLVLQLCSFL